MAQLRALLKGQGDANDDELRPNCARDSPPTIARCARCRSPWARAMWVLPLAIVALVAAPVAFNVRPDAPRISDGSACGVSRSLQSLIGLLVVAAALRESIPGRDWSRAAIALWLSIPIAVIVAVTMVSWEASPVVAAREWWLVGGCRASPDPPRRRCRSSRSRASSPRARIRRGRRSPARCSDWAPGLMADAGWRIFCHFSEPSHVLSAHLAAVIDVDGDWIARGGSIVQPDLRARQEHALHEPVSAGERSPRSIRASAIWRASVALLSAHQHQQRRRRRRRSAAGRSRRRG